MPSALSAAQRSRIRRLARPGEPEPGDGGELNVVPYLDVIMNLVMFVLATVAITFVAVIETKVAGHGVRAPEGKLSLAAVVTSQGVALKTASGNVALGCEGLGAGITIPSREGELDVSALTACARRLKAQAHSEETQVTLTASPGVDYRSVVAVMDALRGDPGERLFPEVNLTVAR